VTQLPWVTLAFEEKVEVDTVLRALKQNEGWKQIANSDGIQTYYRSEEGSPIQR
jgi:hypothetical protein